jgi:RNA polymerase sigma-70 factor (ECF subfamily)
MNRPTNRPEPLSVSGATGGDDAAAARWDQVVERHYSYVLRTAYRLTGNRPDAEDLAQDTFFRVMRSYDLSVLDGRFEGLLNRIATNLFLDAKRREARVRMEELGEDAAQIEASEAGPELLVEALNANARLAGALERLSPELREALVMCDIEGRTYQEIADRLGVALGTVRSRLHRARAQARGVIEDLIPA